MNETKIVLKGGLRWLEFFLYATAFAFLIPAVPSIEGEAHSLVPVLAIGGTLFAASLGLTLYRKADSVFFSLLKLVFYFALVWGIHERVFAF